MTASPSQTFCLFLDRPVGASTVAARRPLHDTRSAVAARTEKLFGGRSRPQTAARWLEVPAAGPASLQLNNGADPIILPGAADRGLGTVTLETVRYEQRPYLLVLPRQGCRLRINAILATRVNIARVGDVLAVDDRPLYLALLNRPYIGPPPAETIGVECGYCRLRIVDDPAMRVYVCPACHRPMHFQGADVPEQDRLECAKAAAGCHCKLPVMLREVFSFVPVIAC